MIDERNLQDPASSRLARMLERLQTQRVCLEHAAETVASTAGLVLEIGLGKGRTYDHLRRLLPAREILVFDREVHALHDCIPPSAALYLGDFSKTLPALLPSRSRSVALAHADLGSEDPARDRALVECLTPSLLQLMRPGGVVLSDRPFTELGEPLPLPAGVGLFPYYLYRLD